MIISGNDLGKLARGCVSPFREEALQPNSVDVLIDPEEVYVFDGGCFYSHDPERNAGDWIPVVPYHVGLGPDRRSVVVLWPNKLYLMCTQEFLDVPLDYMVQLHGVSTMARMGFTPHQQAGLVDSGWHGRLTGEVTVVAPLELTLEWPENTNFKPPRLGQLVFIDTSSPSTPSYRGRYQGDMSAQPARLSRLRPGSRPYR